MTDKIIVSAECPLTVPIDKINDFLVITRDDINKIEPDRMKRIVILEFLPKSVCPKHAIFHFVYETENPHHGSFHTIHEFPSVKNRNHNLNANIILLLGRNRIPNWSLVNRKDLPANLENVYGASGFCTFENKTLFFAVIVFTHGNRIHKIGMTDSDYRWDVLDQMASLVVD
jgi:hypothetical protein